MSIPFPSNDFFSALQEKLNEDPGSTEKLEPTEAYCGFAVGDQLYVLEFDGHRCSAVVTGGNELDLDFVLAGSGETWRRAIDGVEAEDDSASLAGLIEAGDFEVRSIDDGGVAMAHETLPFLQVFLAKSSGLDLDFA